ncbi:MAG TPA: enoyl-CoA hydratase/isomerase family protein [Streptosporangiaceae bacterium]
MTDQPLSGVTYARRGTAGWITLDRPAKRNALTPAMVGALHQALDRADRDPHLRSIVITGAGPAFCAGADLEFFGGLLAQPDGLERFEAGLLRPLAGFLGRLRAEPRPVIAAVNGPCAAGGVELVVCCDLILAAAGATFSDAHSRRGIAPAIGGAAGLVRSLGAHRAKQLMLLADSWDAATLAACGLVAEVVPAAGLRARAEQLAAQLAQRSPASLALMKELVHRAQDPPWEELAEADLADFRASWGSADVREGVAAYAEGRDPDFAPGAGLAVSGPGTDNHRVETTGQRGQPDGE